MARGDPMVGYEGPPISALGARVGQSPKSGEHPEADKLYCEEIDVGEDELVRLLPSCDHSCNQRYGRPTCSGLVKISEARKLLIFCHGMVLL
jgi:tRNA-binding EMAP/Myf-like protein